MRRKPS
jgi:hypothetical protein